VQPKTLLKDVSFDPDDFIEKDYNAHIAYTLPSNPAASRKNKTFLFKSDKEITVDVIKELEQVQLKLTMEQFLTKFFNLWSSDAAVITKLMGLQTEDEYDLEEENKKENSDPYRINYLMDDVECADKKMSRIELLKSLQDGSAPTAQELLEVFNIRKAFEDGYFKDKENVDNILKAKKIPSEVAIEVTKEEINSDVSGKEVGLAPIDINKNSKELTVDNIQELLKSEELQSFLKAEIDKANVELVKANEAKDVQIEALLKAENGRLEVGFQKIVKGFGFINAEAQVELVKFCMADTVAAEFVTGLLKSANDAVSAAKAESEEVKKSFGTVKTEDGQIDALKSGAELDNNKLEDFSEIVKNMA